MVCIPATTVWNSGPSPATDGVIELTRPGFKSPLPQLSVEVLVTSITLFDDEYLAGLYTLPLMLSFDHAPAGPQQ